MTKIMKRIFDLTLIATAVIILGYIAMNSLDANAADAESTTAGTVFSFQAAKNAT